MKFTNGQRKILAKGLAKGYVDMKDIREEYCDFKTSQSTMKRFVDLNIVKSDPNIHGRFNIVDMEEVKKILVSELHSYIEKEAGIKKDPYGKEAAEEYFAEEKRKKEAVEDGKS